MEQFYMAVIWILEDEPVLEARENLEPRNSDSIPAFGEERSGACRVLPFHLEHFSMVV
jgi:hypothetical protein